MYGVFFLLCLLAPIRWFVLAAVSAFGFLVVGKAYEPLGRGLGSFFLGGCVYLTYAWILRTQRTSKILQFLPAVTVGSWIFAVGAVGNRWDLRAQPLAVHLSFIYPVAVLFPLTILTFALAETQRGSWDKRLSVLGDVSYSVYLLHFPVQLTIATVATVAGIESSTFYSPAALLAFITVLLAVSYATLVRFERPAQAGIREWWRASRSRETRL